MALRGSGTSQYTDDTFIILLGYFWDTFGIFWDTSRIFLGYFWDTFGTFQYFLVLLVLLNFGLERARNGWNWLEMAGHD